MQAHYGPDYTLAQDRRSSLRKWVRRAYLRRACRFLTGPTLDFGCGIGELLARLPSGSMGIEYNHASVALCHTRGLRVEWYDGQADDWQLAPCSHGFRSMVLSHVLEHFDEPMPIFGKLLAAAADKGIDRVLVIVPGKAGFRRDATHRTFVDLAMLRSELSRHNSWRERVSRYFPFNLRIIGAWFAYHELHFVVERAPGCVLTMGPTTPSTAQLPHTYESVNDG